MTGRALLLALCVAATPALAAAPSEIAPVIHATAPHGEGDYTFLLMSAYQAQLWTDAPQWSMKTPFALTIIYHMGFSTDDFVSRAKDEMKHVDPSLTDGQLAAYSAAMTKVFPPVDKGDEITALYQPGKSVKIFKNGQPTGAVAVKGFAQPFFGIWLSPATSNPGLRQKLLGQ
jgi:hypothetical protein